MPHRAGRGIGTVVLCALLAIVSLAWFGRKADTLPSAHPAWQLAGQAGRLQFVLLDRSAEIDPAAYRAAIAGICRTERLCYLRFWADPHRLPSSIPMLDADAAAMSAVYDRNLAAGIDDLRWACRLALSDSRRCLPD